MTSPDHALTSIEDLDALLAQEGKVLIFKHSTACPISARAHREFEGWLGAGTGEVRTALVKVIEARPVSNAIAERLGVRQESPQAILVDGGQVAWHASHGGITAASLREAAGG